MDYWITRILHFIMFTNVYSQQFFNTMPPPVNTNFTCRGRDTGFYADLETNCRVYHTCDENGNKFTYYCPAETAFRQEALVCDHAYLVDCANGRRISRIPEIFEKNEENTNEKFRDDGRYHSSSSSSSSRDSLPKQHEKVGEKRSDTFQQPGNSAYTRSFRITQEPRSQFSTPKSSFNGQQQQQQRPTFVLSSSVFLRDRANFKKNPPILRNNRIAKMDESKNANNSEKSTDSGSKKNNEEFREEYSNFFFPSSISTTTIEPFDSADFRAKQYSRSQMIFRSSTTDKKEETTESYNGKILSTTTKRPLVLPFVENYRDRGNSNERRSFENIKFNYENNGEIAESLESQARNDDEKMMYGETPWTFKFGEKTTRDEKIETRDNLRGQTTSNQREFESQSTERNREETVQSLPKVSTISKNWDRFNKNSKELKISIRERPPFFNDNSNFPYSETLRSIQGITKETTAAPATNLSMEKFDYSIFSSTTTTSSPNTIAGTEFPVLPFAGTFSPLGPNELDDDPYYPKHSTTTEAHYKLSDLNGEEKKLFRFSTKRPYPGSLNFEIPEVLPDLNTLDDLVDRRKFFYIPRVKAT